MSEEQFAIEELAECIKELVRLEMLDISPDGSRGFRLQKVYDKASSAKNRIQS